MLEHDKHREEEGLVLGGHIIRVRDRGSGQNHSGERIIDGGSSRHLGHPIRPARYPGREGTISWGCQNSRSVVKSTAALKVSRCPQIRQISHIPGWHAGAQLGHSHGDTLDENPTYQPTPHHATGSSISHSIVQRGCEGGKQSQNGERDTEGSPEGKFSLELLLITKRYQRSFVCRQSLEIGNIAIAENRRDRRFPQIDAMAHAELMALPRMAGTALHLFRFGHRVTCTRICA